MLRVFPSHLIDMEVVFVFPKLALHIGHDTYHLYLLEGHLSASVLAFDFGMKVIQLSKI